MFAMPPTSGSRSDPAPPARRLSQPFPAQGVSAIIAGHAAGPVGPQAIPVSPDGRTLHAADLHKPLLHSIDLAKREVVQTVGLAGVPGWPFNGHDGRLVIVTTHDESRIAGLR